MTIVTGASQGIGAGIAAAFIRFGYAVVANSRSIHPFGEPDVVTVRGDIAEAETAQRVVEHALRDQDADYEPASYDATAVVHPLGRAGEISDVVDGTLYLERASFVTGEILHIDGGHAAGH